GLLGRAPPPHRRHRRQGPPAPAVDLADDVPHRYPVFPLLSWAGPELRALLFPILLEMVRLLPAPVLCDLGRPHVPDPRPHLRPRPLWRGPPRHDPVDHPLSGRHERHRDREAPL